MKKVRYNDTYVYVDDTPLDEKETGKLIRKTNEEELEKTAEIKIKLIDDEWSKDNG